MKVYKYQVDFNDSDELKIALPIGAQVLSFGNQNEKPVLWALVDPDALCEIRRFRIAGTGHEIDKSEDLRFIGTALFRNGSLVFHLFERIDGMGQHLKEALSSSRSDEAALSSLNIDVTVP